MSWDECHMRGQLQPPRSSFAGSAKCTPVMDKVRVSKPLAPSRCCGAHRRSLSAVMRGLFGRLTWGVDLWARHHTGVDGTTFTCTYPPEYLAIGTAIRESRRVSSYGPEAKDSAITVRG